MKSRFLHFFTKATLATGILFAIPAVSFAAPEDFRALVNLIVELVNNSIIPLIFAIAILTFMLGVLRYFFSPGSEENVKKGRQVVVWGIVALFVMLSIWGFLNLLERTIFFDLSCVNDPNAFGCGGP